MQARDQDIPEFFFFAHPVLPYGPLQKEEILLHNPEFFRENTVVCYIPKFQTNSVICGD